MGSARTPTPWTRDTPTAGRRRSGQRGHVTRAVLATDAMRTKRAGAVHDLASCDDAAMSDDVDAQLARVIDTRRAGELDESLRLALELSAQRPEDARVAYQTAWAHDRLGREAGAVAYYEKALERPGLSPDERRGALLGLGSTYRTLGRYVDARATLRRGVDEFPDYAPLKVFLAMSLYNCGDGKLAVETLLQVLVRHGADKEVAGFSEAIALYAEDLDRVWLEDD
jgi:tetratricopeptide (TPR) repeat protein